MTAGHAAKILLASAQRMARLAHAANPKLERELREMINNFNDAWAVLKPLVVSGQLVPGLNGQIQSLQGQIPPENVQIAINDAIATAKAIEAAQAAAVDPNAPAVQ